MPTTLTLNLARRPSLVSLVLDELEHKIMSGVLKPGEPINEKALSDRNGLSRAPIREACRRLEQAGLIEIIDNRGAFVRKISRRCAQELCELRLVLARHAGPLIVERTTAAELKKLQKLVEKIEAEARSRNLERYYALNEEFHLALIDGSGNARLATLYRSIAKELNLYRWRAFRSKPALESSMAAHRAMIGALSASDKKAFCRAMEDHLTAANRRITEMDPDED
jgi:DNA-binding GntR family transcriptional regulator